MNLIQAQQRIQHLEIENVNLKESNKKLIEEQKQFQDALIAKVQEIKKLGPFKKPLNLTSLLGTLHIGYFMWVW